MTATGMSAAERRPVVCFAGDDYWTSNPHSRYHFMHALHRRGHRILWVNSIGMHLPKLGKSGFARRVRNKLGSWSRFLRQVEPGFDVLSPIALPLFGQPKLAGLADRAIEWQVRHAYHRLGITRPFVFASIPSYAEVILKLPRDGMVYYYSDKYDSHRNITARDEIRRRDQLLFHQADAVFCVSREIHDDLASQRPHVHYLPHAVDAPHFAGALASDRPEPADLAGIPHPRVGYYGSLGDGVDRELILHAARELTDHQFVLIGKVLADYGALAALPNVHFLGMKAYEEIPHYGKGFDVALQLFIPNEWTYNCSPLKTKEYLSLGLPVISCPIREIERELADVVPIVASGPELVAAIRHELATDSPERRRARIARVAEDSWDARTEQMLTAYEAARRDIGSSTT
jgi:hypothetical protein